MPKFKILVVDDESDLTESMSFMLQARNFDVITASDGLSGLSIAKSESPDLVLLDIMMPGMDGFDLCNELKKDRKTKNIPVIMLTAKGETESIIKSREAGADDYIVKPFGLPVLINKLDDFLVRGKKLNESKGAIGKSNSVGKEDETKRLPALDASKSTIPNHVRNQSSNSTIDSKDLGQELSEFDEPIQMTDELPMPTNTEVNEYETVEEVANIDSKDPEQRLSEFDEPTQMTDGLPTPANTEVNEYETVEEVANYKIQELTRIDNREKLDVEYILSLIKNYTLQQLENHKLDINYTIGNIKKQCNIDDNPLVSWEFSENGSDSLYSIVLVDEFLRIFLVNSLINHLANSQNHKRPQRFPENENGKSLDNIFDLGYYSITIDEVLADEVLGKIYEIINGDEKLQSILDAMMSGYTKSRDIAKLTGFDINRVYQLRRELDRRLSKFEI